MEVGSKHNGEGALENHLSINGALTLLGFLWVMMAELWTVKLLSHRESKAVDYFWLSRSFSMPLREFWGYRILFSNSMYYWQ